MWLLLVAVLGLVAGNSAEMESKIKINPETHMNISEIIKHWRYPSEEYEVLTKDGYYLSLNRIRGGSKGAVLLLHGEAMEGSLWIANPPNESLGFILADAKYDVWIGNFRGNSWSRKHINLTIDQKEFWNFTFHEMGIYDIPAMTNFILNKTKQKQMHLVGYNQGASAAFVALSVIPQLATKIKMVFALAPLYTLSLTKSPFAQIVLLPDILIKLIFGRKEFAPVSQTSRKFLSRTCSYKILDVVCKQVLQLIAGFNEKNLNESRTDVYLSKYPDSTSVKNILHVSQTAKTGQFKYFDYGPNNMIIYKQATPPSYKIEQIAVPIAVWSGGHDWVSQPAEISQLLRRIRNLTHAEEIPDWNHWDFVWGIDARQRVYGKMLSLMRK